MAQFGEALQRAAGWFGLNRGVRRRLPSRKYIASLAGLCIVGLLLLVVTPNDSDLNALGVGLLGGGAGGALGAWRRRGKRLEEQEANLAQPGADL
jgi:hypothetical protein